MKNLSQETASLHVCIKVKLGALFQYANKTKKWKAPLEYYMTV